MNSLLAMIDGSTSTEYGCVQCHIPGFTIKAVELCYVPACHHRVPYKNMSADPALKDGNVQKCADGLFIAYASKQDRL